MYLTYGSIEDVEAMADFKVKIRFHTGREIIYDVKDDINTQEFYRPLRDIPGLFETVHVCQTKSFIVWEHKSLSERIDIPYDILSDYGVEVKPVDAKYVQSEKIVSEIIRLRKMQGLTQSELGKKAGIKQPVIARIENGRVIPRMDTVLKLLNALDAQISVISSKTPSPTNTRTVLAG